MARNKYIYTMSQAVMVVKSNKEKGGTWTGATENLKKAWVPLLVRDCSEEGNQALIQAGGIPLANDKVPYSQLLTQGTQSRENFVTTATASTSLQSDLFADQLQQTIGKSDYIKEVKSNKECISDTPIAVLDESDETLKPAYGVIFGLFQDTLMQLSQGQEVIFGLDCIKQVYPELQDSQIKKWLNELEDMGCVRREGCRLRYALMLVELSA